MKDLTGWKTQSDKVLPNGSLSRRDLSQTRMLGLMKPKAFRKDKDCLIKNLTVDPQLSIIQSRKRKKRKMTIRLPVITSSSKLNQPLSMMVLDTPWSIAVRGQLPSLCQSRRKENLPLPQSLHFKVNATMIQRNLWSAMQLVLLHQMFPVRLLKVGKLIFSNQTSLAEKKKLVNEKKRKTKLMRLNNSTQRGLVKTATRRPDHHSKSVLLLKSRTPRKLQSQMLLRSKMCRRSAEEELVQLRARPPDAQEMKT